MGYEPTYIDSRFIESERPDTQMCTYTCAACGATFTVELSIDDVPREDRHLPEGLQVVVVGVDTVATMTDLSVHALVALPVCEKPDCVRKGARIGAEQCITDAWEEGTN